MDETISESELSCASPSDHSMIYLEALAKDSKTKYPLPSLVIEVLWSEVSRKYIIVQYNNQSCMIVLGHASMQSFLML